MTTTTDTSHERQEAEAFKYVRKLRGFYLHVFQYVVINLFLLTINLVTAPHHLWVLWVMGGWGLGLALHGIRTFNKQHAFLGPEWERRQVEKRLGRPL